MPRTLPWLKDDPKSSTTSTRRKATAPSVKHARPDKTDGTALTRSKRAKRSSRTPSTSPPPASPDVEFMRNGDNEWMMVEDEFLSTAQAFTRHLHHAEYQRIKQANKLKTQETLSSLRRPTKGDAFTDKASARAIANEEKRRAIDKGADEALEEVGALQHVEQDEDSFEEAELAINDRNLSGLMHGDDVQAARHEVSTASGAQAKSNTRAAAGMSSNALATQRAERVEPSVSTTFKAEPGAPHHHFPTNTSSKPTIRGVHRTPEERISTSGNAELRDAVEANRRSGAAAALPNSKSKEHLATNGHDPKVIGPDIPHDRNKAPQAGATRSKAGSVLKDRLKARQAQREREQRLEGERKSLAKSRDEVPMWL